MHTLPLSLRRSFSISILLSVVALVLYYVSLQPIAEEVQIVTKLRGNLANVAVDILAVFWCFSQTIKRRPSDDKPLPHLWSVTLIGLGCLLLGIADAIWSYLEWYKLDPFPSAADFFYLGYIPCLLGGVLLLPTSPLPKAGRLRVMLDGMLTLTALVAFSWRFIIGPTIIKNQHMEFTARILAVLYPACDLLVAACLIFLFFRANKSVLTPVTFFLGAGLLVLLAGDSVFLYQSLRGTYTSGTSLDLTWPGSALLCGLAARYLSFTVSQSGNENKTASESPATNSWLPLIRAAIPYLLVPLVGVLFFSTVMHSHRPSLIEFGVYISVSLLVVLIVLRQFVYLLENLQLYRQTRQDADRLQRLNSELQATQAELVHSAKMASLGTLSAGVAHELNQPVAIIRGISQQLLMEKDLPIYAQEDLQLIEAQTGRMMKIIQHLRTFCRTTGFDVEETSLHQIVRNSFILVGTQLRSHGIDVLMELAEEDPVVSVNANEIEQVFLNLITNARDALENQENATLTVRSRITGNQVALEFADNGKGIASDKMVRIFDPFFTTKEVGKGTGLGLSISQNLIQKNGGTLTVHNDNGAVFTIMLPYAAKRSTIESVSERGTTALLSAVG